MSFALALTNPLRCLMKKVVLVVAIVPIIAFAQPQQGRVMKFLGRFSTGLYNLGGAETVAYDTASKRLFLTCAQGSRLMALDIRNPSQPRLVFDSSMLKYGGIVNSVAVHHSIVAVAIEDTVRTNPGKVVFLDTNGRLLSTVSVGSVPDMLTFTPNGRYVLVANEGEPSDDYTIDPEGSVSIIDVTNITAPTVRTASFTAFNPWRDSLRLCGIRIGAPNNPTVAQDLEPEYIAISPDSRTAYVTLQENNAVAIVDIETATVRELLPLEVKDLRKGGPTLQIHEYPLDQRLPLGVTSDGQTILLGGLSGLWYDGTTPDGWWRLYAVTDRGPNAEPTVFNGIRYRPFVLPSFQPRIVEFHLNPATGQIRTARQILLYRNNAGTPLTGLPNLQASQQNLAYTDELACDLYGTPLANDPLGADFEGLVRTPNGEFWACDEYRPALYRFDSTGVMIARYVPIGTAASVGAQPGTFGQEVFPSVYAQRRPNRGFEAIAVEGTKLYLFLQSPLDNPNSPTNAVSRNSSIVRILEFDYTTTTVTGEYLLPLLQLRSEDFVDKIGDAVSLGNRQFLVAIRDSRSGTQSKKLLYEINLRTATNTIGITPPSGTTFETLGIQGLLNQGIRPAACRLVCNLAALGYQSEKVEGLARIDDSTYVVINDNDFGVQARPIAGNGTVLLEPDGGPIYVAILRFSRSQRIDPSDRDNGIRLRYAPGPVFGLPQPDAIAAYRAADGQLYLVTANEGDTREYGTYNEQARMGSSSAFPLDPIAFPSTVATQIRRDSLWGRLQTVRTSGDLDGDGDYDELYISGTRSFSIIRADGSLVYDSGDEFDRITAALFPAHYNCSNTNNTLDARSPNRGTEPEGVAIATIGDSIYAFICLERIGGVLMYNVTNPYRVRFVDYLNTRNFNQTPGPGSGGDLGPEVVCVIPSHASPNRQTLIITANEVSGTVAIYGIEPIEIVRHLPPTRYICLGSTLRLEVTATGPSLVYQWYKNGNPIPGATGPSFVSPVTSWDVAGEYSCRIFPTAGLAQPLDAGRCSVVVTPPAGILRQPPATLSALAEQEIQLVVEVQHESPEVHYQWLLNNQPLRESNLHRGTRTSTLILTKVTPSDTGTYTCLITSFCDTLRTAPCRLSISPLPRANVPSIVRVCSNRPQRLNIPLDIAQDLSIVSAEIRHTERQVSIPAIPNGRLLQVDLPTVTERDTGNYTITVTLMIGVQQREYEIGSFRLALFMPLSVEIQQQGTLCPGGSTIELVAVVPSDSVRYQWFVHNRPIPGGTTSRLRVGMPAQYEVEVVNPCEVKRQAVYIEEQQLPRILTDLPESVSGTAGQQITLRILSQHERRFQWFRNDTPIVGATSSSYSFLLSPATRGIYHCRLSNECGEVLSRRCTVDITTTALLNNQGLGWGIYPNPLDCTEQSIVVLPPTIIERIELINMKGQMIHQVQGTFEGTLMLDHIVESSVLSTGAYLLVLHGREQTYSTWFIVSR